MLYFQRIKSISSEDCKILNSEKLKSYKSKFISELHKVRLQIQKSRVGNEITKHKNNVQSRKKTDSKPSHGVDGAQSIHFNGNTTDHLVFLNV